MRKADRVLYNNAVVNYPTLDVQQHKAGIINYEITNYLGNVNAVITDRKTWNATGVYFEAVSLMKCDYYPFGMEMPGRKITTSNYRYGYNGMEKDDQIKGEGNSYTTEFRQYDPRLGRWLSLDPLMHQFPWMSPYVAFDNNPIYFTDPFGLSAGDPPKNTGSESGGDVSEDGEWKYECRSEHSSLDGWVSSETGRYGNEEQNTLKYIIGRINNNNEQINKLENSQSANSQKIEQLKTELSGAFKKMAQLEAEHQAHESTIARMELTFDAIAYLASPNHHYSISSPDELSWARFKEYELLMGTLKFQREAQISGGITMCYPEQYFIGPGAGKLLWSGTKGAYAWGTASVTGKVTFHTTQKFVIRSSGETTFGWGIRNTSTNAMIRFERHSFMVKGMSQGTKTYMTHFNIQNGSNVSHYFLNPFKLNTYGNGLPY
jgi:RHS repeat-associated protein